MGSDDVLTGTTQFCGSFPVEIQAVDFMERRLCSNRS